MVFTPWDRPVFAVENQTSSTDAHNLWTKGFKRESNLLVLEPGAKGGGFVRWRLARIQPTAVVPGERPEDPHARYDQAGSPHLAPLLTEVIRYPTVAGNDKARKDQQAWLKRTGEGLKFTVRDAGLVTEIELPASAGTSPGRRRPRCWGWWSTATCSRWRRRSGPSLRGRASCRTATSWAGGRRTTRGRWCRRCWP